MPSAKKYLAGFGVHEGLRFGPYVLTNIEIEHVPIRRYREYEYPTALTFQSEGSTRGDARALAAAVMRQFAAEPRTIYTSYGNPYRCDFQWPIGSPPGISSVGDGSTVVLHFTGHSQRI